MVLQLRWRARKSIVQGEILKSYRQSKLSVCCTSGQRAKTYKEDGLMTSWVMSSLSAEDARAVDGNGRVDAAVASNFCVLIEFNEARKITSSSIVQGMDERGGRVVVPDDRTGSQAWVFSSNMKADLVLLCMVGS